MAEYDDRQSMRDDGAQRALPGDGVEPPAPATPTGRPLGPHEPDDGYSNVFSENYTGGSGFSDDDDYIEGVFGKSDWRHVETPLSRLLNHWVDRLVGAASDRSLSAQEEQYSSHETKRDYICNTAGIALWGMVFPLLTIVVTQLVGAMQAGLFSLAFVTASLLMILANFGVRTFQVSDLREEHSFADYQVHRVLTCLAMIIVGYLYCRIRGYADTMFTVSMGVYIYRMVDGLADVYEGRLQQADKMYLAGISQALRSALVFIVFTVVLFILRNLAVASVAMAIVALASFFIVTLPLATMETPKSRKVSRRGVADLFKRCAPLFVALFLYSLIDNMPKFLMEGVLTYDNQLYFNALYFPAMSILLAAQLVYRPLLLRIAAAWEDRTQHREFRKILMLVIGIIIGITTVVFLVMNWIGAPIMSFLYGLDFEPFHVPMLLMIVAGGVTAAIDFLYQVITVQRRQNAVMKLYLVTFVFSIAITLILVHTLGLMGAVVAYLAQMILLLVLIGVQFAGVEISLKR